MTDNDELRVNKSLRLSLSATWQMRGVGSQRLDLLSVEHREIAKFLFSLVTVDEAGDLELTEELVERLRGRGILVPPDEQPSTALPFDYDLPLVPPPELPAPTNAPLEVALPLVVNPSCGFAPRTAGGEALHGTVVTAPYIREGDRALWVTDAGTDITSPYRISAPFERIADFLIAHAGADLDLSDLRKIVFTPDSSFGAESERALIAALRSANILIPRDFVTAQIAQWESRCDVYRRSLLVDGFVVVRSLLNPMQIALMRAHYRRAIAMGYLRRDVVPVDTRIVVHNDPALRFYQSQLAGLFRRITAEPIKASYTFTAHYEEGAVLTRHVDRPQCAWNLSMPLDAQPETDAANAWPIYLETHSGTHEVRLGLGDGLLYRGIDSPHWRHPQPPGHACTVGLFHFVPEDFDGSLE